MSVVERSLSVIELLCCAAHSLSLSQFEAFLGFPTKFYILIFRPYSNENLQIFPIEFSSIFTAFEKQEIHIKFIENTWHEKL